MILLEEIVFEPIAVIARRIFVVSPADTPLFMHDKLEFVNAAARIGDRIGLLIDCGADIKSRGGMTTQAIGCDLRQLATTSIINIADISLSINMYQLEDIEVVVIYTVDCLVII